MFNCNNDFMSLYEELSLLNESKEDIEKFINKFGEDTYELFKKSTQRLKNNKVSTDLTYHIKHTDKKDLEATLRNLQNRAITKDGSLTELAGDYEYLGEDKGYKVYKINDVIASINFGAGTGWCISGRYEHYGEKNYKPTREEAEKHWNNYISQGVQFYFFIGNKSKVALALYPNTFTPNIATSNTFVTKTNYEIYNERDDLDYNLLASLPVDLLGTPLIFEGIPIKNGLYIKDTVLFKCDNKAENIVIPDGITRIADKAFESCEKLKTVMIPNSVISIGTWAFFNCSSLNSITIPSSITSIGDWAFCECGSLTTSITIPNSIMSIGDSVFSGCSSLTSVTIGNNVTSIGDNAFCDCSSLTSIIIPDSVTSIGVGTFSFCDKLRSITIPDSVTSIGAAAFSSCSSLTSITIPDSVTSIEWYTFDHCRSLKSIKIGSGITSIGKGVFNGCTNLTNIYVDKNNPNYKVVDGHLYDKSGEMII